MKWRLEDTSVAAVTPPYAFGLEEASMADLASSLDPLTSTTVSPVIVTAPRPSGWSSAFTGHGEHSGNGVGSDPYAQNPDYQLENEAMVWAGGQIILDIDLSDANQRAWYDQIFTALSNLYFIAHKYPNAFVDGPESRNFTAASLFDLVNDVKFRLTTQPVGDRGAWFVPATRTIEIDVDDLYMQNNRLAPLGAEMGRNYVIFHELGHADPQGQSLGPLAREMWANTLGYAMASLVGMPHPTVTDMQNNPGDYGGGAYSQ